MANNFFNDNNKAYSENLNDGILVGNAFDWTVDVALPTDTGGVFPNSSTIVMAKVADVYISPNSNLSIGSTISNSSGSSQVYRLTVYPNFNRYGGFKSISVTGSSGVTFYIANKGATSPIASNLDYSDLSSVPELKVLKEYDIVLTIPNGKSVSGLEFVFQSSSADVSGSINQANVSGLQNALSSKVDKVNGKGLSSNDFTDTYKSHLDDLVDDEKTLKNGHTHNGWQEVTLSNQYASLYVNMDLRLAEFKYYQQNVSFTSTSDKTVADNIIPAQYRPVVEGVPVALFNPKLGGNIDSVSGNFNVAPTETGNKTVNAYGIWRF